MPTNRAYFAKKFADDAIEHLNYGVDKATNEPKTCANINCDNCKLNPSDHPIYCRKCDQQFQKWLIENYEKPQPFLTYKEYCFLDMLRPVYKYMGRDNINRLFISTSIPIRQRGAGEKDRWEYVGITLHSFNVKFDFIGTDKYWSINDLKQLPIKEEPKEE